MAQEIKRMRYFNGLFLKEDEFNIERDYNLRMRRLHNHHLHGFGIVWGLIVGEGDPGDIVVSPGMAIDKSFDSQFSENTGREIVIVGDRTVDLSGYGTADVYVWISYNEDQADVVPELGGDEPIHLIENATIGHSTTKPTNVEANLILAKVLLVGGNVDQIITEEGGESLRIPLVLPTAPTDPEPGPVVESQVSVTPWTEYPMVITATTTNPTKATTPTIDKAYWRRVGDTMEIEYTYYATSATGAAAGSGTYLFSLPSGYAIDSTKINLSTIKGQGVCGSSNTHNVGVAFGTGTVQAYNSTNLAMVSFTDSAKDFVSSSYYPMTTATLGLSFRATVPIANWTTGTVGSFNKVEYAYNSSTTNADDTTSFAFGELGGLVPSVSSSDKKKRVRFSRVFKHVRVEVQPAGSGLWMGLADSEFGRYEGSGTKYGIVAARVNDTDWDVQFHTLGYVPLNGTPITWSTEAVTGTRWRVVASDNPLFVEGDGTESQVSVTSWTEYALNITATSSNPTKATSPTIDKAYWRRVGDSMEIEYNYVHTNNSGSGAGSGTYLFSIPAGFTIDASKIAISTNELSGVCGNAAANTAANPVAGFVKCYNTNNLAMAVGQDAKVFVTNLSSPLNSATMHYSFRATIPIAEWTTGTVGSFNRVEYAYNSSTTNADDTTSFSYGENGSLVPVVTTSQKRKRVRFSKSFKHYELEFQENGIGPWLPAGSTRFGLIRRGGSSTGMDGAALIPINATDFDVAWTELGCAANDISSSTNTWPLENSNGTRWRVVASDNPLFVESGPESQVSVTSWLEFPMTITGTSSNPTKASSPTIDKAYWRRVGDSMEISYSYRHSSASGASAGTGTYLFAIPVGYAIDTSKIVAPTPESIAVGVVGSAAFFGGAKEYQGVCHVYDSNRIYLTGTPGSADATEANYASSTISSMADAAVAYSFRAVVPIAGWTTGTVGSFNRVEYLYNSTTTNADDTAAFAYGESGGLVPTVSSSNKKKRVRFSQAFKHVKLEIQRNGIGSWLDVATAGFQGMFNGANTGGMNIVPVSATDYDVYFDLDGAMPISSSSSWAAENSAGTRWRVVGCDNPLFVEAADAEFATATSSVFTPATSGQYYALTGNSVTLTAGKWSLTGSVDFGNAGSVGYNLVRCSWHAANGANSATEPTQLSTIQAGQYVARVAVPASDTNTITAPTLRLNLTTASVIYLVPFASMATSATAARITTNIYAERIS